MIANILLVEDDELDVTSIKRSLDKLGVSYHLNTAGNGEEALSALERRDSEGNLILPDIVMIDINMPKMNGLELLTEIRKREEWKNLKCFMITSSDDNSDKIKARELGVSGYIIKPLKLSSPSSMEAFNLMIDITNLRKGDF